MLFRGNFLSVRYLNYVYYHVMQYVYIFFYIIFQEFKTYTNNYTINICLPLQKVFTGTLNNFGEDRMCCHMLDELRELVENGKIQTVVDRVFQPLDIEHALNHMQSTESIGSTVITFR